MALNGDLYGFLVVIHNIIFFDRRLHEKLANFKVGYLFLKEKNE